MRRKEYLKDKPSSNQDSHNIQAYLYDFLPHCFYPPNAIYSINARNRMIAESTVAVNNILLLFFMLGSAAHTTINAAAITPMSNIP